MAKITLYSTPASPFARRIHLALRRGALAYDTVNVDNLFPPPDWYTALNPLGLIPSLVVDNEDPVFDSSDILEFLDDKMGGIWPKELQAHWREKRFSGLCEGMMLDAVNWRVESIRENARADILAFRELSIARSLKALELKVARDPKPFLAEKKRQGASDLAIALHYLQFRMPHLVWETKHPFLADVLDHFLATSPPGMPLLRD